MSARKVQCRLIGEVGAEVLGRPVGRSKVGSSRGDVLARLGAFERGDGAVFDDARGSARDVDVMDVGDGQGGGVLSAAALSAFTVIPARMVYLRAGSLVALVDQDRVVAIWHQSSAGPHHDGSSLTLAMEVLERDVSDVSASAA